MPLPIEALRAVRSIIVHRGNSAPCPDGRASALILHAALPHAHIAEMVYNSPEHKRLMAEPGMLFCDFSPPKDRLQEFVDAGAIVIDHHHPDVVAPFAAVGRGVWGDNAKGESGARLAYREVLVPITERPILHHDPESDLAHLAAIRDTWQSKHRDWKDACEVSAALLFPPLDDLLAMTPLAALRFAAQFGPMLLKKQRLAAQAAADTAVTLRIRNGDFRLAIIADHHAISDAAEILGDRADLVTAFEYVHDSPTQVRLVVHLRSRGTVDCQAIARHYPGGGGHKGAAGFPAPIDVLEHPVSPYEVARDLIENALYVGVGL